MSALTGGPSPADTASGTLSLPGIHRLVQVLTALWLGCVWGEDGMAGRRDTDKVFNCSTYTWRGCRTALRSIGPSKIHSSQQVTPSATLVEAQNAVPCTKPKRLTPLVVSCSLIRRGHDLTGPNRSLVSSTHRHLQTRFDFSSSSLLQSLHCAAWSSAQPEATAQPAHHGQRRTGQVRQGAAHPLGRRRRQAVPAHVRPAHRVRLAARGGAGVEGQGAGGHQVSVLGCKSRPLPPPYTPRSIA